MIVKKYVKCYNFNKIHIFLYVKLIHYIHNDRFFICLLGYQNNTVSLI
jgi:hypothetical protein